MSQETDLIQEAEKLMAEAKTLEAAAAHTEFQVTDVPAVLPPHSGDTLTVVDPPIPSYEVAALAPETPAEPAPAEAPAVGPVEPVVAAPVEETLTAPVQSYAVLSNYNGTAITPTPEYTGKRIAGQPVIKIQGREYSADSLSIEWKEPK
jgi:hypothetical protein